MKMQDHNGHVAFLLRLYDVLLEDMVRLYGNQKSFMHDRDVIRERTKVEGLSFLTKTLPSFGKAIDMALVTGTLTTLRAFKKRKGCTYPAFLQVLCERVFLKDGTLKEAPEIAAVRDLRQVLYLVYKYEGVTCNDEILYDRFKVVDRDLGTETPPGLRSSGRLGEILNLSRTLVSDLFADCDMSLAIPGHGPGAVATGEKNWEKYQFKRFYTRIHQVFPYYKYFFSHAADLLHNVSTYWGLERDPGGVARCVTVPKDSRGNRLISMEPLEFQYVQQAVKDVMYRHIEAHPLTSGHVNFTNQEINRELALQGSVSGEIVTLDMKEASDRISLWLVSELFRDTSILKYLLGTRTEATELGTGEVLLLNKFAPMGSATCFPVESVVHWALAVASLVVVQKLSLAKALKKVYVYGDDIVIKGRYHEALYDTFPHFGLMFNVEKSCATGLFRESCGMDAFQGEEVTPLKLRCAFPQTPYDARGYVSYINAINAFWERKFYTASSFLHEELTKIFGYIPNVDARSDTPGLVEAGDLAWEVDECPLKRRYNKRHHSVEYCVLKVSSKKIMKRLDRCEYMRKLHVQAVRTQVADRVGRRITSASDRFDHLLTETSSDFVAGVYAVPRRINLKQGWSTSVLSRV